MDKPEQQLEPLPYHVEVRDYLKTQERALWDWFASARAQADYTESLRMDLLKSTYRLDAEGHPELFKTVEEAKTRLQLDIPVTLYQAQNSYLLLDFVTADPELDDMPLAAALELSRQLDLEAQFEKLAAKELKMKVRDVRNLKEQAKEMLTKEEVTGE